MSAIAARLSQANKLFMFLSEFSRDFVDYVKYCGVSPFQDKRKKLYYKLIIETHAIEKGLSLANPRLLFGRQKIPIILRQVRQYGVATDDFPVLMAVGALQTYLTIHRAAGVSDPMLDDIAALLDERACQSATLGCGGLRHFPEGWVAPNVALDGPTGLLASRFSCRMFADMPVDPAVVERIVAVAQTAPSQCNRQSTKIHFYNEPAKLEELLRLQQGSTGFAETVRGLFVVAFDLAAWGGAQQRNQGYVDAALFSQNLMLAAHALGVVACPLNLAVRHSTEHRIRAVGGIPSDQRLVMMIAIGWPQAGALKAAASPRRPTAEILTLHGPSGS